MADNKNENQQSQAMLGSYDANWNYVDPYGVTFYDWFTGKNLNNADTEKSAYWDDSSLDTYNTGNNKWGTNDKYTWENTRNTYTWYNADIKTADLDPNYQYGWLAQQQESIENWYLTNRNDNIASALYNEWKTSIEDVSNFLNQQQWFQNSTEEQRQNTINAVWKRIGQIASENQNNNTDNSQTDNSPSDTSNEALSNMESDLMKSTAGELYGKVTADSNQPIKTLEDQNSVYKSMNEARMTAVKALQAMDSQSIAASIISWTTPYGDQWMRDLMQYDSAKYQEVKQAEKELRGQMNINSITSWDGEQTTAATNAQSNISNDIQDFAVNNSNSLTSAAEILKNIKDALSSNVAASSARETMDNIENDMATLQNRLKNLKQEANQVFKWDVPQYIVNAYVANRTAEIQNQLSILENRYNSAQSRYQQEWEQTKWTAEFWLKLEELQLKKDAAKLNDWATRQWIDIKRAKNGLDSNSPTINWGTVQTSSLSREEISASIDDLVEACKNWQLWNAQCAAWIQNYYLPALWVNLWTLSKRSEKQWICNESAGSYTPQKWDLVVIDSWAKLKDWTPSWHMWIVVGIDWDTMTYLDWNGSVENGVWTEKAEIRTKKLTDGNIYGYYNPTKITAASQGYDPAYADIYGKYLQWKFAAWKQLETQAKAMWKTVEQLDAEARAWKSSQNNNQEVKSRLDAIQKVLWSEMSRLGRMASEGTFFQFFSSDYADWDSAFDFIKDNITFDKLLELKSNWATFWALSDNELRAIGNAAANLNRNMSKAEFEKQLTRVYNELLRWMWEENYNLTTEEIKSRYTGGAKQGKTTRTATTTRAVTGAANTSSEDKAKMVQWF